MTVSLLDFKNATETGKWDAFVYKYGQLYHLSYWAEIISSSYGFKPCYLYIEDNDEIRSVFPLFHVKIPFLKNELVSIPHLEAGGILNPKYYRLYLDYIFRNLRSGRIRFYQYNEELEGIESNTDEVIMYVRTPETREEIISNIRSQYTRRPMRRVLEQDYEVVIGNDGNLLKEFYSLYTRKMKEFGTPPHSFTFMKKISGMFGENCKITMVRDSGKALGAFLSIIFKKSLFNLYAGTPGEALKKRIGLLLEYKTMEMAIDNKLEYYIFGRTSKESGTYFHKSVWGSEPVQLYLYSFAETSEGFSPCPVKTAKQRYVIFSKIWAKMPVFLTDRFGPVIRKWVY